MAAFSVKYKSGSTGKKREVAGWRITMKGGKTFFYLPKSVYLNEEIARACCAIVDKIERFQAVGEPLSDEVRDEIERRPAFKQALARKGVIDVSKETTVGELWTRCFKARERGWSGNTPTNRETARKAFFRYFKEDALTCEISEDDVCEYERFLRTRGQANGRPLAESSKNGYLKCAREVWEWGVSEGVLRRNVFKAVKIGKMTNPENNRYIETSKLSRLLTTCDRQLHWSAKERQEWRVILVLNRIAGLRCPSEINGLKWSDFNFKANTFEINDVKRKRRRMCPIFEPIRREMERLQAFRDDDSGPFVIGEIRTDSNLRTMFRKLIDRAGLEYWPKIFQNLRKSASTDIRRKYGAKCESEWVGHSEDVSFEFYQQTTPDDFRRALTDDWELGGARDVAGGRPELPLESGFDASVGRLLETPNNADLTEIVRVNERPTGAETSAARGSANRPPATSREASRVER